ncbi:MltA domain-containing protein [Desulfovibrio sp. OttesenSCG-928-F20]|nr:MltA domain-containing protein [Desulfovibrio sp. OttesenSCG-928-M16]MDL2291354.1 MltA domain-containing protein [Desulfovibrio sp. OttesenSCG-928-F20]
MDVYKTASRSPYLIIALLLLACLVASCGGKPGLPGFGAAQAPSLFTPLSRQGAFAVGPAEAQSLALKMNVSHQGLTSWKALDFPLAQSLAHVSARPASAQALSMPGLSITYGQLADSIRHLRGLLPQLDAQPGLLARDFTWYRIGPDFGFTGYFEPSLRASRKRSAAYPYPLYRVPPDLRKGAPYHTRHAIDRKGVLAGRGLEIAWVSSEMDAFFLHIQGSGRLIFENGSVSHALYAGKNNRKYVPLGRVMRDEGLLEANNVNMQSIRECLLNNPDRCAELYDSNPSYVFFREAAQGPVGAMGRPLTPYVSLASDRSVLPLGSLLFSVLPLPDPSGRPGRAFYGLTLPQDVGGAIKGHRLDLFCGAGPEAAHTAGYLDNKGAVYVLLRKR